MEEAWTEKYPENQKEILLEWQKFELAQPDELKPFLERLINLIDPQDRIHLDEEGLILPVKYNNKTPKYWRKWISGDWFEQLIYTWFKENGVKDENLETGLQIRQGESQGNETDILLFHKNQLIFCELKSDLSSQSNLADPLRQVIDQSLNMGKVRRVLILSPKIQNDYQKDASKKQQWTEFERNCAAKNIQIIIARDKEALKELSSWHEWMLYIVQPQENIKNIEASKTRGYNPYYKFSDRWQKSVFRSLFLVKISLNNVFVG